jgi:D-amino peptidase
MRFYISADIEGVGGLAHFDSGSPGQFDYGEARVWMTNEVIAACEGAKEAGCDEVIISDSHYNGLNIIVDRIPTYARLVRSWPRPLHMMSGADTADIIGAGLIGYHVGAAAMTGLCPHTFSGAMFVDVKLDGQSISETHISALQAGEVGVPVLLASGDDAYVIHAREVLGDIECVTTKKAISHTSAETLPPSICCDLIRAATKRAIVQRQRHKPIQRQWPAKLEIMFKGNRITELLGQLPQFERINGYTLCADMHSANEIAQIFSFLYQMASLK